MSEDCQTSSSASPTCSDPVSTSSGSQETASSELQSNTPFDLSDPIDLERKLNLLTEEQMEELLREAYQVNKELKNELLRRERNYESESLHDDIDKVQLPPLRNASASSSSSRSSAKRGFTSLGHKTSQHLYSSPVQGNRQKARTAVKQPSKPKPEWNDRFGV